ncbi:MAG TPA: UrcA family protein [Rhizomicrobium sp.]|nr:UrcA family protein [Rhizomicrobium sp.]
MIRLLAAVLFAVSIIPAAQAAGTAPKDVVVAYGDLDLGTAAGQSALKDRLQDAAAQLCSPVLPGPDYRGSEQSIRQLKVVYRACVGRLSERAMARIPALGG